MNSWNKVLGTTFAAVMVGAGSVGCASHRSYVEMKSSGEIVSKESKTAQEAGIPSLAQFAVERAGLAGLKKGAVEAYFNPDNGSYRFCIHMPDGSAYYIDGSKGLNVREASVSFREKGQPNQNYILSSRIASLPPRFKGEAVRNRIDDLFEGEWMRTMMHNSLHMYVQMYQPPNYKPPRDISNLIRYELSCRGKYPEKPLAAEPAHPDLHSAR